MTMIVYFAHFVLRHERK